MAIVTDPTLLEQLEGNSSQDMLAVHFGNSAARAKKIIDAESSGNPIAVNKNTNGTVDRGLFQINSIHTPELKRQGIIRQESDLFDPDVNVQAASFLYRRDGWQPWKASQQKWGKGKDSPKTVTDPNVLAQLEGETVTPVTDAGILKQLEGIASKKLPGQGIISEEEAAKRMKGVTWVERQKTPEPTRNLQEFMNTPPTKPGSMKEFIATTGPESAVRAALGTVKFPVDLVMMGMENLKKPIAEKSTKAAEDVLTGMADMVISPTGLMGWEKAKTAWTTMPVESFTAVVLPLVAASPKAMTAFKQFRKAPSEVTWNHLRAAVDIGKEQWEGVKPPTRETVFDQATTEAMQKPVGPEPIPQRPVTDSLVLSELEKPVVESTVKVEAPQTLPESTLRVEPTNGAGAGIKESVIQDRVYHGTASGFDPNMTEQLGKTWVTTSPEYAALYADAAEGGHIVPMYADIRRPFDFGFRDSETLVKIDDMNSRVVRGVLDAYENGYIDADKGKQIIAELKQNTKKYEGEYKKVFEWWNKVSPLEDAIKKSGYDGLVAREGKNADQTTYAVFSKSQLKSAFDAGIKEAEKPVIETIPEEPTYVPTDNRQPSVESLEAMVKGGRVSREMPKYAEGSSINLERLETTNDVKELLRTMTQANEEKIGKRTISWDETRKTAEELGWDYKDLIKQRKGKAFTAAEIDAARQLHMNALTDLFDKIKNIPADRELRTADVKMDIMNAVNNYSEVLKTVSQASSEAGRALNIHRRMIENNPEFLAESRFQKVMQDIIKKNGADKITDKMIEDLRAADWKDPKAVSDIIAKYNKATIKDMLFEAWINGLLSGPRTHARNIAGNTLALLTKPTLETPMASIIDFLRKGNKREYRFGEVPAEMYGAYHGIIEGVRAASRAWKSGMSSEAMSKVEFHQPAIPGKTGEIIRIPTRALTAADEFFKAIIYRSEIQRQAYRMAAKEGLSKEARLTRMAELIDNPTPEMMRSAHYESQYRTFNKPLGNFGNAIMGLRDKAPGLRYIVPFVRTPANIFKFALERTPANIVKIAHDAMTKKLPLDKLPEELAKPLTGTAIGTAIYLLANEGYITGGGPKNKKSRDILYSLGWQPYSIRIGDTYYGYNTMEPVGSVMGMAADFSEAARTHHKTAQEKAGHMIFSITRNLTSKTFVTGISASLDAISDPERYAGDYLNRYVGSLIPSLVNTAAQTMDNRARKIDTPLDAIKARIPGLSQTLPEKRAGGRIIKRDEPVIAKIISPMYISKGKQANKEVLDRLITK